jgi:hypothetical protein
VILTRFNDVSGAFRIDPIIRLPVTPDSGHSRCVKDRFDFSTGFIHCGLIPQVALNCGHAQSLQRRILTSTENSNSMPLLQKLFNDVQAKKSASASDESLHEEGL